MVGGRTIRNVVRTNRGIRFRVMRTLSIIAVTACMMAWAAGCSTDSTKPPVLTDGQNPALDQPSSDPGAEVQVQPILLRSFEMAGQVWSSNPDQTISPDKRYVLAVQTDSEGTKMAALPLTENGAPLAVLHSADKKWIERVIFNYYPLGWISDTRCIFVIQGWQNNGPHQNKRGIAFMIGDVETSSSREAAFIGLPEGYLSSAKYVEEKGKVYIHISKAIWEYDVKQEELRLIKGDMPTYAGFFNPRISPDGSYYVYERHEGDKEGIFLLDIDTGLEKPLLLPGDTMSFYPSWSPDGRYVAAYTVNLKEGMTSEEGVSPYDYDLLEGEDAPQPVGSAITVVDLNGTVVNVISVKDKMISDFIWGQKTNTIGFVSGSLQNPQEFYGAFARQFIPESLWIVNDIADTGGHAKPFVKDDATSSAVTVAEMGEFPADQYVSVVPVAIDPDGQGIVANDHRDENLNVWHIRKQFDTSGIAWRAAKIEGGFAYLDVVPIYGDSVVGVVERSEDTAVCLFGANEIEEIACFERDRSTYIVGCNEDMLVISSGTLFYPSDNETSTVKVFKITSET